MPLTGLAGRAIHSGQVSSANVVTLFSLDTCDCYFTSRPIAECQRLCTVILELPIITASWTRPMMLFGAGRSSRWPAFTGADGHGVFGSRNYSVWQAHFGAASTCHTRTQYQTANWPRLFLRSFSECSLCVSKYEHYWHSCVHNTSFPAGPRPIGQHCVRRVRHVAGN